MSLWDIFLKKVEKKLTARKTRKKFFELHQELEQENVFTLERMTQTLIETQATLEKVNNRIAEVQGRVSFISEQLKTDSLSAKKTARLEQELAEHKRELKELGPMKQDAKAIHNAVKEFSTDKNIFEFHRLLEARLSALLVGLKAAASKQTEISAGHGALNKTKMVLSIISECAEVLPFNIAAGLAFVMDASSKAIQLVDHARRMRNVCSISDKYTVLEGEMAVKAIADFFTRQYLESLPTLAAESKRTGKIQKFIDCSKKHITHADVLTPIDIQIVFILAWAMEILLSDKIKIDYLDQRSFTEKLLDTFNKELPPENLIKKFSKEKLTLLFCKFLF